VEVVSKRWGVGTAERKQTVIQAVAAAAAGLGRAQHIQQVQVPLDKVIQAVTVQPTTLVAGLVVAQVQLV
jgi:hypothetical protein